MPRRQQRAFIWIPKKRPVRYGVTIDGESVFDRMIGCEFTHGIIGMESTCKIKLVDVAGGYAAKFTGGQEIIFYLDFSDGTTAKWKGTVESPKTKVSTNYELEINGTNYQSSLLDITVTESYNGNTSADAILKALISKYLEGYTSTNVLNSNTYPTIVWSNKPFWDCILDLCEQAECDCYVDVNKDFHFFGKESINNDEEAFVWDDTIINIDNLGTESAGIKNRVIVYGEDSTGHQIFHQADDTDSQSTYGIKECIIQDKGVNSYDQAKEVAEAKLVELKEKATEGKIQGLIMPDLVLGAMHYVIYPPLKIHQRYRIVSIKHMMPDFISEVIIAKEKSIPLVFKERRKAEIASVTISNPHRMKYTFNLPFDDYTGVDTLLSDHITIESGNLRVSGGFTEGNMISTTRECSEDITSVYLLVDGDTLSGTKYYVKTDDGQSWASILPNTLTATTAGKKLTLKIALTSSNTTISGVTLQYVPNV